MTDEHQNRRRQDPKLDLILQHQEEHMNDFHAGLQPGEAMEKVKEHDGMVVKVDRIVTVLEGIPDYNANGEVIGYIGGMRNDLSDLQHRANGGSGLTAKMTWTSTLKVAVLTSAMTGTALMVAAVISKI